MSENSHGQPAVIGQNILVWLTGESPFARCTAIHADGSWDGELVGPLIPDLTLDERRTLYQTPNPPAPPHDCHGGEVRRFKRNPDGEFGHLWVLA